MPRRYDVSRDGFYHIVQHAPGDSGEVLFREDADRLYFISLLKDTHDKFGTQICVFALMDNHVHICVKIVDMELSEPMKFLFQSYAQYFNLKYKRKGCLYSGRFFSRCMHNQLYILICSLYIHLNPCKSCICEDARDFRWSSVLTYTVNIKNTFLRYDLILDLIAPEDMDRARAIYRRLLTDKRKLKLVDVVENKNAVEYFFADFFGSCKNPFEYLDPRYHDLIKRHMRLEEEVRYLCLKKRLRKMEDLRLFKEVVGKYKQKGYTQDEIAQKLGRTKSSITNTLKR